jgi:pimeloyl-ACP methyl ester carboxylesterase
VIAPDLIGHGYAARVSSYAVKDFVEALKPQIESHIGKIDVVVGHSLGGIVALGLHPYLLGESKKALRVVLVDPVFKQDEDVKVLVRKEVVAETTAPWTVEQYQAANPRWTQVSMSSKMGAEFFFISAP